MQQHLTSGGLVCYNLREGGDGVKKKIEVLSEDGEVATDYPINKFGSKMQWWTSEQGLDIISGWRRNGLSIKDIVEQMDVDVRTFRSWRKKCPRIDEILAEGKDVTVARVADALYKKARGFYYDESVEELVEGELRVVRVTHKYCPPDTKAILAWLYNRDPEHWQAVQMIPDINPTTLAGADNVLVTIREAASEALGDHGSNERNEDVLRYSPKTNPTEANGEPRKGNDHDS